MRRMITESDVEKLDSIKPSEMQKLAAMQDPKEARANQVLTADGTGKAVYKDASGKTYNLNKSASGIQQRTLYFYIPDTPLPESVAGNGDQLAARVEVRYVDSSLFSAAPESYSSLFLPFNSQISVSQLDTNSLIAAV